MFFITAATCAIDRTGRLRKLHDVESSALSMGDGGASSIASCQSHKYTLILGYGVRGSERKHQFSRCFASFASIKWKPYPLPQNVALSFVKQLQLLAESGPEKRSCGVPLCGFIDSACRVLKKLWPEALSMGRLHLKVSECFPPPPLPPTRGIRKKASIFKMLCLFCFHQVEALPITTKCGTIFRQTTSATC